MSWNNNPQGYHNPNPQQYNQPAGYPQQQHPPQGYHQQPQGYHQQPPQQQQFQGNYQQPPGVPQGTPAGGYQSPANFNYDKKNYQLWEWFKAVDTDNSGSIDANNLKQALSKGGMVFSSECASLMIKMFDTDGNRTVDFHEFEGLHEYLMQMKSAFMQVDDSKCGYLNYQQVYRAVTSAGYKISPQVFQQIFKKFDRHNSQHTLGFDGYIELCVFLGTARNLFQQYDTNKNGWITMNFESFINAGLFLYP